MNLDFNIDLFRRLLYQSADAIVDFYEELDQRRTRQIDCPVQTAALFAEPMPEACGDPERVVQEIQTKVFNTANMNVGPNYYGYVTSGGTQIGAVAEALAGALDQNGAKWDLSPPAVALERLVVAWIAEFIGYSGSSAGVLTSGGSEANLVGLAAARRAMTPWDIGAKGMAEHTPMTAYVSSEGHSSLDKAVDLLGIGRNQLRKIPVKRDFTIDMDALEARVHKDRALGMRPFCVIGNAGAVNTGAVDPLDRLADFCADQGLWLHVDAAYGGPAAAVDDTQSLFTGMARADSLAIDPHKWLYAPYEAGCALVQDLAPLQRVYRMNADYLDRNDAGLDVYEPYQHSFPLSRGFKALKIWATFKTYGAERLRAAIEDNIRSARYMAELVEQADDLELLAPVPLSIVCFRYVGDGRFDPSVLDDISRCILKEIERDGRVFLSGTKLNGAIALRACLVNHRTERSHAERVVAIVREIGARVAANLSAECAA